MNNALYPGTFDPVTLGHLDIIERASKCFDHLYIGVVNNVNKQSLFTVEQRQQLMEETVQHLTNVSVITFSGLSVDAAKQQQAKTLIRGLRVISDFEYELQLAATNRYINPDIETLFLMASTEYSYISSTLIKELASYHADISLYTSPAVEVALKQKYGKDKK